MRAPFLAIALLFTGCVTIPPQISGPYAARLSLVDIQGIQRAVSARSDIEHQIRTLEAQRRDRVYVRTGRGRRPDDWSGHGFYVINRSGTWYIDERSPIASVARVPATY